MTTQIKHFIEVADIVAIRLTCKRCETSLLLPLIEKMEPQLLGNCPQCYAPWAQLPNGPSISKRITDLMGALRALDAALKTREETLPDQQLLSLTLEVKQD